MQLDQPSSLRIVIRPRLQSVGQGDSLEELDVREFADKGTVANVVDAALPTGEALYYLDRDSTAAIMIPNVVPALGGGRWLVAAGGGGGGGITAAANVGGQPGEVFRNIVAGVLALRTLGSSDGSISITTGANSIDLVANGGFDGGTTLDKGLATAGPVAGDQAATGLSISATPANNGAGTTKGYVQVFVNGGKQRLGPTRVAPSDCFFSGDGGVTARALDAIQAGDDLYWNTSVAGFALDTTDRIDFDYVT